MRCSLLCCSCHRQLVVLLWIPPPHVCTASSFLPMNSRLKPLPCPLASECRSSPRRCDAAICCLCGLDARLAWCITFCNLFSPDVEPSAARAAGCLPGPAVRFGRMAGTAPAVSGTGSAVYMASQVALPAAPA